MFRFAIKIIAENIDLINCWNCFPIEKNKPIKFAPICCLFENTWCFKKTFVFWRLFYALKEFNFLKTYLYAFEWFLLFDKRKINVFEEFISWKWSKCFLKKLLLCNTAESSHFEDVYFLKTGKYDSKRFLMSRRHENNDLKAIIS